MTKQAVEAITRGMEGLKEVTDVLKDTMQKADDAETLAHDALEQRVAHIRRRARPLQLHAKRRAHLHRPRLVEWRPEACNRQRPLDSLPQFRSNAPGW